MANVFIDDSILQGWADTVREKTGTTDKMLPSALLTQTQENWGTGGGGESGVWTAAYVSGIPRYKSYTTISGSVYALIPEDAVLEWAYVSTNMINASTQATVGSINVSPFGAYTEEAYSAYPGYKMVTLTDYSFTLSSSAYCQASKNTPFSEVMLVRLPNAYLKDGILYAGADCKGIFPESKAMTFSSPARYNTLYMEGLDLRGSQVQTLPPYCMSGHTELKKVWLSDVYSEVENYTFHGCANLEEIHFTKTTPCYANSSAFSGLSTTCKIYVPAGTLSAYTTARNYPSASTYTYIEE